MSTFSDLKCKGDKAFRQDDLFQAISYYTDALAVHTDDQDVLGCRSAVYSKLGMYNEAKNDAERLIIAVPNNPKGYFLKAVALENLRNYSEALKFFLAAYERDSRHPTELVLNIVQVSGYICQLSKGEEINLFCDGNEDDYGAVKFKELVQIGKRFCKSNNYILCNAVLKTALSSHCNLSHSSSWFEDTEKGTSETCIGKHNSDQLSGYDGGFTIATTKKHVYSSMYLTTGFHGNMGESQLDEDERERTPMVDTNVLMSALATLSRSFFSLAQYKQALQYSKHCLQLALDCESKKYELKTYVQLANIYQRLGDYLQAISYNGKLLAVGRDVAEKSHTKSCEYQMFWNGEIEHKAVWNLTAAYKSLGEFRKALGYAKEYLDLLKVSEQGNLTFAYSNLGELEFLHGNLNAALECYKMATRLSKKFSDKHSLSYAYGNMGKVYAAQGNYKLSEVNHVQHLTVAQSIGDRESELVAVKQLGDMFALMGQHTKALEHYQKHLGQVKVNQLAMQCRAYGLIADSYWKLNQLYRAQHFFEQCLNFAVKMNEKEEALNSRCCLAKIMKALHQFEKCRQYYNDVIPVLEHKLRIKQGDDVIYEDELVDKLAECYGDLQEALIEMSCVKEALEICEHWKSRFLVNFLRCRAVLKVDGVSDLSPYTSDEILRLVDSHEGFVLVYSCVTSGFMGWMLAPGKGVVKFYQYRNCEHQNIEDRIKQCIEELHSSYREDISYKCDQRALPCDDLEISAPTKTSLTSTSCFVCTSSNGSRTPLQRLYEILIEPFREEITRDDGVSKKLVIVPGKWMTMIPFPSLQDRHGGYLYENIDVSIIPCIRALSLKTDQQKQSPTDQNYNVLVAGNPEIPSVSLNSAEWRPTGKGDLAEQEVTSLATLLAVKPVTGCQATKEHVLEMLSQSSLAHLVTYGSWTKGCLAFTPNPHCHGDRPSEDSYLLSVSDLVAIDIPAKVVVLSSCCSCSHKFCYLKQVNLNLATAFLAAGAKAVVIQLWSAQQPVLLKLYYHLYSGLEKGETINSALKGAWNQVKSVTNLSNPVLWSSHTMLGFDASIDMPRLRHKLFDKSLDCEVSAVGLHRVCFRTLDSQDNKAKAVKFREILTNLMLQHGTLPNVLPSLRDVIKLANSMLAAYEETQSLEHIVMSSKLSSKVIDAPSSHALLLFLGFSFQKDGAKDKDPFVVFPHWDYETILAKSAVIFDAVCTIFDVSSLAGHSLARLLTTITHCNMEKLKELLTITTKYPARIVKTTDFVVRVLWCNKQVQRFLVAVGFYDVGQSLLFNKNDDNQTMVKGALKIVSKLLDHAEIGTFRSRLSFRELTSEDSRQVKLVSLSPLVTATNQIVMGTPWMSKRAKPDEAKVKLKFAKELETIIKDFSGVVTRSNYWHSQLLRAQGTRSPSLPDIGKDHQRVTIATPETKKRLKVKVVSGLTPSCDRRLVDEGDKLTNNQARHRRNAIYKIYGQRFDNITMRKRNEIRELFKAHAEETK